MDEFDEGAFQDFLAKSEADQNRAAYLGLIQNRFRLFLQERGVPFPDGRILNATQTAEEMLDIGQRFKNVSEVVYLSTGLAVIETLTAAGTMLHPEELTDLKKRIQAKYIAEGADPAWVELIDQEFPGDSLSDNDNELIDEVRIESFTVGLETDERLRITNDKVKGILAANGVDNLSREEVLAAAAVTSSYCLYRRSGFIDKSKINLVEDMRLAILNSGVMMNPAWQKVIDYLSS